MKSNITKIFILFIIIIITACSGGGSGDPYDAVPNEEPVLELQGDWELDYEVTDSSCGDEDFTLTWDVTVTEDECINHDISPEYGFDGKCEAGANILVVTHDIHNEDIYGEEDCVYDWNQVSQMSYDEDTDELTGTFTSTATYSGCSEEFEGVNCTLKGTINGRKMSSTGGSIGTSDPIPTESPAAELIGEWELTFVVTDNTCAISAIGSQSFRDITISETECINHEVDPTFSIEGDCSAAGNNVVVTYESHLDYLDCQTDLFEVAYIDYNATTDTVTGTFYSTYEVSGNGCSQDAITNCGYSGTVTGEHDNSSNDPNTGGDGNGGDDNDEFIDADGDGLEDNGPDPDSTTANDWFYVDSAYGYYDLTLDKLYLAEFVDGTYDLSGNILVPGVTGKDQTQIYNSCYAANLSDYGDIYVGICVEKYPDI